MFADEQRAFIEWCGTEIGEVVALRAGADDDEFAAPVHEWFNFFAQCAKSVLAKQTVDGLHGEACVVRTQNPVHQKVSIAIHGDDAFDSACAA